MLPVGNRLTSSDHIKSIQRSGTCLRGTMITLCFVRSDIDTRFAVVVGQKTSRSAVVRTRVKRKLRGALTHAMKSLPTPVHGVVMTRAAITKANAADIKSELEALIAKIK